MDFPGGRPMRPVLSSYSIEASGLGKQASSTTSPASSAWPAANRAIYVPFVLPAAYQVTKLWWANGATAAGNVDCGIYSVGGTKLASTGSTAQAGTSVVQSVSVSILLQPGSYYMALALSSISATILRNVPSSGPLAAMGVAQQATAFPLPATATFAAASTAYFPMFGITSASVI